MNRRTIKIVGRNHIFSPPCLIINQCITKETQLITSVSARVTKCLQLSLQDFTRIINNYAYSGGVLK